MEGPLRMKDQTLRKDSEFKLGRGVCGFRLSVFDYQVLGISWRIN